MRSASVQRRQRVPTNRGIYRYVHKLSARKVFIPHKCSLLVDHGFSCSFDGLYKQLFIIKSLIFTLFGLCIRFFILSYLYKWQSNIQKNASKQCYN